MQKQAKSYKMSDMAMHIQYHDWQVCTYLCLQTGEQQVNCGQTSNRYVEDIHCLNTIYWTEILLEKTYIWFSLQPLDDMHT